MSALHKLICGVVVLASAAAGSLLAQQQTPAGNPPGVSESSEASERQRLLESRRWRQLQQMFHDWLSVQNIYTPQEIAEMKARLQQRIQDMTAAELEDFMDDAEERLHFLLGDEAMQARSWLNFFTPQARREMVESHGKIPDVLDMSVSQLRRELDQFRQERAERGAAQAALNRSREQQVAGLEEFRQTQQQAIASAGRPAATFGTPPTVGRPPRHDPPPRPAYWITPWGGVGRAFR